MSKNKPPLINVSNDAPRTPTNKNTDTLNPVKSGSNVVHNVQTVASSNKLYYSQPSPKPVKPQSENKPELPKINFSTVKRAEPRQTIINDDVLNPIRTGSTTLHNVKTTATPKVSTYNTAPTKDISKPITKVENTVDNTDTVNSPRKMTIGNQIEVSRDSLMAPVKTGSDTVFNISKNTIATKSVLSQPFNTVVAATPQVSYKLPQITKNTSDKSPNFSINSPQKLESVNFVDNYSMYTYTEAIPTVDRIFEVGDGTVIVDTDKDVYINTYQYTTDQNYIKNVLEGGASLNVGITNVSNVYSNIVSNVNQLAFDTDSGFVITELSSGTAKVILTSIFKNWQVNGLPGITSEGTDTVNFIAGAGVQITADNTSTPKSITISSVAGNSGYSGQPGPSGYSGISGASTSGYSGQIGESGYSGVEGLSGYSGVSGDSGISGYSGLGISGYSGQPGLGISGYSGQRGDSGYSGVIGISGYSGLAGNNNLIWTENGIYRTLTAYKSLDSTVTPIRTAEFFNSLLRLTLASFTPTLSATGIPSTATLNWDIPITGFTVTVVNPDDILTQYISDVSYLIATIGTVSTLANFTAGAKSATPAPTVDWNQTFTTGATGYVRANSSTISGGSAVVNVFFKYFDGNSETQYTASNAVLTVNWNTPTMTTVLGTLTGNTFLATYTSVSYTITVTNVTNAGNYVNTVTPTGGTVSNPTGSGTFTFTTPINKNNTSDARTLSNTTVFTRPIAVTGVSYTASLTVTTTNPSITFTYPTLWVWTASTFTVPTRSTFVLGTGFQSGVTVLGNQVKTFASYVNNTDAVPRGFWFAVRTAASQPTIFKTGASPSLLSDVTVTTGNSVNLAPDSPPAGYTAEPYTLYGITLQPGSTYVSIS